METGGLSPLAAASAGDAERAARGDAAAFERLYRSTVARVHALARRLVGPAEADEATQEVYVRAWRKLAGFRREAEFATWLHQVAVSVLVTRRSNARTRRDRFADDVDPASLAAAAPAETPLAEELDRAIQRLPPGCREVFVLHEVEGLRHDAIARALGISTGTSKSQLHRARTLLRAELLARGERHERP